MRRALHLVLALLCAHVACEARGNRDVERRLRELSQAEDDGDNRAFAVVARDFLRVHPEHAEADRIRYAWASTLVADNILTPTSTAADEARRLLDEHERVAKDAGARFDAALLRLKFSPNADPFVTARAALLRYRDDLQSQQIYSWAVSELGHRGRVVDAASLSKEWLERFGAGHADRASKYRRIVRRASLLGAIAPFDEKERVVFEQVVGRRLVMINFWASWCTPCVAELPALRALYDRDRKRGLEIIAVGVDGADAHQRFLLEHELPWLVIRASAEEILERFGLDSLPAHILLDAEGKVIETELDLDGLSRLIAVRLAD